MAKPLKTFDWDKAPRGPGAKYDWDAWLNGKPWEIHRGEDFDIAAKDMIASIHLKAAKRGLKVRTHMLRGEDGNHDGVIFQSFPRD